MKHLLNLLKQSAKNIKLLNNPNRFWIFILAANLQNLWKTFIAVYRVTINRTYDQLKYTRASLSSLHSGGWLVDLQ